MTVLCAFLSLALCAFQGSKNWGACQNQQQAPSNFTRLQPVMLPKIRFFCI